jgi:hypothetical protein
VIFRLIRWFIARRRKRNAVAAVPVAPQQTGVESLSEAEREAARSAKLARRMGETRRMPAETRTVAYVRVFGAEDMRALARG